MQDIDHEATRYETIKAHLMEEYDDLDDETLADTLEGLTDLREILAATLRSALDDEAFAQGLKERIEAMRARLLRLKSRAQHKRSACARAMAQTDIKRIMAPDLTVSLRQGPPKLVIEDEASIPEAYWKVPDPVLSRTELKQAMQAGRSVPGAELAEADLTISVRVK